LVEYKFDEKLLDSENFIAEIAQIFKTAYPFNKFLNYTVDEVLL
jgi:hypothetical protein